MLPLYLSLSQESKILDSSLIRGSLWADGIRVRFEIICIDFRGILEYKYNVEIHPFCLCKKS